MISVELTTKGKRKAITIDENKTVKEILEANSVDYRLTPPMLNGMSLDMDEINSTFADLGVESRCTLTCVVKTSNA